MTGVYNSTEQAREALRKEHEVRQVAAAEEGSAASHLPDGVFGFTGSPILASPLFAVRRYRNFEVHRLVNGRITVIGFATPAQACQLTRASSGDPVTLVLHPDPDGEASAIVSVPYDRIAQHRQYSVRNAGAITLHVTPLGQPQTA